MSKMSNTSCDIAKPLVIYLCNFGVIYLYKLHNLCKYTSLYIEVVNYYGNLCVNYLIYLIVGDPSAESS